MISIIIPAHNEELVIERSIRPLLPGIGRGEFEVIVVCNGCTDRTAEVVKALGGGVRCLETGIPSKTNALNLGDQVATGFPRIYQDADVVLSEEAVHQLAQLLDRGEYLAASPQMQMDYGKSSWAVRSYYQVWQALPYVREGMIGTGVYALSEKGRSRFGKFPDVVADDGFVRASFKGHERVTAERCYSVVRAPQTLSGLIRIKTRSRLGGYELRQTFPGLLANEEKNYGSALATLLARPGLWLKIPVYLFVNLVSRVRARRALRSGQAKGWERDDSSRQSVDSGNRDKG